jgi:hypothetical protein
MYPPDLQRVVLVAATSPPFDTRDLEEAVQVNFDQSDDVSQTELLDQVLTLLQPAPIDFEEKRRQTDWGATGLYVQDILVNFSIGMVAGLTVEAIIAGLRKLSRRAAQGPLTGNAVEMVPPATTAEAAWRLFAEFLGTAFKVSRTMAKEVVETETGWRILAIGNGCRFDGSVSKDGRILRAQQVSDWTMEQMTGGGE